MPKGNSIHLAQALVDSGMPRDLAVKFVSSFDKVLTDMLVENGRVTLPGFGEFRLFIWRRSYRAPVAGAPPAGGAFSNGAPSLGQHTHSVPAMRVGFRAYPSVRKRIQAAFVRDGRVGHTDKKTRYMRKWRARKRAEAQSAKSKAEVACAPKAEVADAPSASTHNDVCPADT